MLSSNMQVTKYGGNIRFSAHQISKGVSQRALIAELSTLALWLLLAVMSSFPDIAWSANLAPGPKDRNEIIQPTENIQKMSLQKDIEAIDHRLEAFSKRLDDQMNRVSDIGYAVDRFGVLVTIVGFLLTVILAVAGVVGYYSTSEKARREAASEATRWLAENGKRLDADIKDLANKVAQTMKQIDEHLLTVVDKKAAVFAEIEKLQETINKASSEGGGTMQAASPLTSAVQTVATELRAKPESMYSFNDWNVRAFAAHASGKLDEAAHFWGKAAETPAAGAVNVAQAMFNRAQVLAALHREDEALLIHSQIIFQFGEESVEGIREIVAKAIFQKGSILGHLRRYDEAFAAFTAVIERYAEDIAPEIVKQRTWALNGLGFTRLCLAKREWKNEVDRIRLLGEANEFFDRAFIADPTVSALLGNQAYCAWLQGDHAKAETKFVSALANGGKAIYEATLEDLLIFPVEEDVGFKVLIARLWQKP